MSYLTYRSCSKVIVYSTRDRVDRVKEEAARVQQGELNTKTSDTVAQL